MIMWVPRKRINVLLLLILLGSSATYAARLPELFRHPPGTAQGQKFLRHAWHVFRKSPAARQGPRTGPVMIQIAFDPDCPFCHALWQKMQRYRHSAIVIRWVPLSLVRASTLGKAAAIVTAADPIKALAIDERSFNVARRSGGILPLYHVKPTLRHIIRHNTRVLTSLDSLVPTLLYRDKKRIGILAGVPKTQQLKNLISMLLTLKAESR